MEGTDILVQKDKEVQMAVKDCGKGRGVYLSGLPYSFENSRLLYRCILWAAHGEEEIRRWFSTNLHVEVHAYEESRKYCVVNNTAEKQKTTILTEHTARETGKSKTSCWENLRRVIFPLGNW